MSARKSVYRVRDEWAESRPSPNEVKPKITVELRVFWPPNMGHEERVATIVRQVAHEAILAVYPVVGDE